MFEHPSPLQIFVSVVSSVAAILALGAAIVGYFYHDLSILERSLFALAACFLFGTVVADNNLISLVALVAYAALLFRQRSLVKGKGRRRALETA